MFMRNINLTATTGDKNERHESRADEDVYLYCARVQRKNKLTFSNYTFFNYTFSNVKTPFALLVTHKEKRQSRMSVNLKKDRIRTSRCSDREFLPHLPPGSDRCGR